MLVFIVQDKIHIYSSDVYCCAVQLTLVEKGYSFLLVFTWIQNWEVETRNRKLGLLFSTMDSFIPKAKCLGVEVPSDI